MVRLSLTESHARFLIKVLEQGGGREEEVEAEPADSMELVEAKQKRDTWKQHAESKSTTNYAREQFRIWERRVAELEQMARPIRKPNVVPFDDSERVVTEFREIRRQVANGPAQREFL